MTITADGWFDWMDRDPGPADKVYSDRCLSEIVVFHDAVGYYAGWMSRLKSTARDSEGRYTPYAAASVTGWLPYKAGVKPIQHYSIMKSCWASGSRYLNVHGNAFENESAPIYTLPSGAWAFVGSTGPGDWHSPPPQSAWQVACAASVELDLAEFFGRPASNWRRPTSAADVTATEYEHNETTRWGGLYSSCPNGRIRWADIAAARGGSPTVEEDEMALSPAAEKGIEEFFATPYKDMQGRTHTSKAVYLTLVQDWLDSKHLGTLLASDKAILQALAALSVGGVDYAALAKAVNDDAAARLKE